MKIKLILSIFFLFFTFFNSSISDELKLENKINKNLRCLICQGQSIYDSQSDFAESMKLVVKQKINSDSFGENMELRETIKMIRNELENKENQRIDEIQKNKVKFRSEIEQLKKTISILRKTIEELSSGKRKK